MHLEALLLRRIQVSRGHRAVRLDVRVDDDALAVRVGSRRAEDERLPGDRALDDPTAELLFWLPETAAFADAAGSIVAELPQGERARTEIQRDDARTAVLLHDPSLLERRDFLDGVLAAAALSVEMARLRVELRLQLAEVEASRTRIVEAGYEERRRLESDLHDGAQQRLVSLGVQLRRLQRTLPRGAQILSPALDQIVDEVGAAIADVRQIAAGVRPARLDDGLEAALRNLARSSPVPVQVDVTGERVAASVAQRREGERDAAADRLRRRSRRCHRAPRLGARRPRGPCGSTRRHARGRQPEWQRDEDRGGDSMRIVIAEDAVLLREGLAGLLEDAGHTVLARVGDAESLLAVVAEHDPDLAIVDVRMPPNYDDEGMLAAVEIRRVHPRTAVLVLSQHVESRHAVDLVGSGGGFGYLLKDRVLDVDEFLEAAERVSRGGSALDPEVVKRLPTPQEDDLLAALTPREREVLGLMAEGKTNAGIAKQLWLAENTVETHVRSILGKLELPPDGDTHRRVLAVVTFLRRAAPA